MQRQTASPAPRRQLMSQQAQCTFCYSPHCSLLVPRSLCHAHLRHLAIIQQDNFRHGRPCDTRYCYELFRRAIRETDSVAWEMLHYLFTELDPVLPRWVRRHYGFPQTGETDSFFVNAALLKFFNYFRRDVSRFDSYDRLETLLALLRSCVRSVITDFSKPKDETVSDDILTNIVTKQSAYDRILFWHLLEQSLPEIEYVALAAKFRYGLTQAATLDSFPEFFNNPSAVYRALQQAQEHIRNDVDLRETLSSLL